MNHADFIVWMVAFPISQAIVKAIEAKFVEKPKKYSDDVEGFAALILISLWIGIGYALW